MIKPLNKWRAIPYSWNTRLNSLQIPHISTNPAKIPEAFFLVKIAKLNLKLYGRVEELEWPRGSRIRTRPEDSTLPEIKIYYSIAFT